MNHGLSGNTRGLTLLELVVGLTITGLAVSAGYAALASLVDNGIRAERTLRSTAAAGAKRRLLRHWLEGTTLSVEEAGPAFRGVDGVSGLAGRVPDDELTFLTTAPTPVGAERTVVRLYINRDSLTPERGLVAELSRWPPPAHATTTRIEIEPEAGGLDCRYFTRTLGRPEWLPSWISSTVLPIAVEVRVLPLAGDTIPPLLALPLLVRLGNGA